VNRQELLATLPRPDRAGVFDLPARSVPVVMEAAAAAGLVAFRVGLAGCTSREEVLARLGEHLGFPEWYGQNWDALADCLTDFSWQAAAGYVLVLEQLGDFRAASDEDFDTLIEILSDASASWSGLAVPFWAFLVTSP